MGATRAADALAKDTDRTDLQAGVQKECISLALQIAADITLSRKLVTGT